MKKTILIINFIILFHSVLFSQYGWFLQNSNTQTGFYDAYFINSNIGWVVGGGGTVLKTTNGGTDWQIQNIGTSNSLHDIYFLDSSNGYIVGQSSTFAITTDAGDTWVIQPPLNYSLNGVVFTSINNGVLITSGGKILRTIDGGNNWSIAYSTSSDNTFNSIDFLDQNNGVVVGGRWDGAIQAHRGVVIITHDGGVTWQPRHLSDIYTDVQFIDIDNIIVVGTQESPNVELGSITRTTNGGSTWSSRYIQGTFILTGLFFTDENNGYITNFRFGGADILYTSDGGQTFTSQYSGSGFQLSDIFFSDLNNGWAVGSNGTILHTDYGGFIPVELSSFTASSAEGKVFLNWTTATELNNLGFEIERKITIVNESNWIRIGFKEGYGTTTESQSYQFIDDISDLQATSLSYRLKQIDFDGSYEYSDEVLVDNPAPIDYALQQNYPNPFNPTTKITYTIPQFSFVTLKVYDVLGNEVAMLVNEEKPSGSYEVEFSANGGTIALTSGVYFYRIQVGSYVETRKMLLMK